MIETTTAGWEQLLTALDQSRPILHSDQTYGWPSELILEWVSAGLCHELPLAQCMACTDCEERPFRDVVFTETVEKQLRALLPCPNCGLIDVPLDHLKRWEVDRASFVALVAASLPVSGSVREFDAGRLWRLGRLQSGRMIHSVWFGYRLSCRDANDVLSRINSTGRVLLIVPSGLPRVALPDHVLSASLHDLTVWREGRMQWDGDALDELLQWEMPMPTSSSRPFSNSRQSRAADIEALTLELKQHLQAARDHAVHTRDIQGAPALLPRPSQKELARRLGISESRVSRSLNDPAATQLKLLWNLANDLDQILRYG